MNPNSQATEQVAKWNQDNAVGQRILYREILMVSVPVEYQTRHRAFLAEDGTAAIMLSGKAGYVALSHCEPINQEAS